MAIRLPPNLCPWPVADIPSMTAVCGSDEKTRDGVNAVLHAFAPLKDPIEGKRHIPGESCFHVWMNIDKVDWARTCSGQYAEIVSLGEQRIKCSECTWIGVWMISARDVGFRTEPRFQWNRRKAITGLSSDGPCANICGTKSAKLPQSLIVEVPAGSCVGDRV